MHYITVYDAISQPEGLRIPWLVYGLVVIALVFMAGGAVALVRRPELTPQVIGVAMILFALSGLLGTWRDYQAHVHIRQNITAQHYTVAEGCLDRFHPGTNMGGRVRATHEFWSVGGYDFEYASGQYGVEYHDTAGAGGAVDARTRVRVTFADAGGLYGRSIVRLEVVEKACPPAPDIIP